MSYMQRQEIQEVIKDAIRTSLPISEQTDASFLTESEIETLSEGIFNALSGFAKKKAADVSAATSKVGKAVGGAVGGAAKAVGNAASKFAEKQRDDWEKASIHATRQDFDELKNKLVKTIRNVQADAIKIGGKLNLKQEETDMAIVKAFSVWRNGFSKDPLLATNKAKRGKRSVPPPLPER